MSRKEEELRRKLEIEDLRAVMSTREGRRFVWRMLGQAKVFHNCFVPGSPDTTAYNEGCREFGLILLQEIMAQCPGSYLTMQKEAMANEQRRRKADDSDSGGDVLDDAGGGLG